MQSVDGYEPQRPHWREIWKQLSPQARAQRFAEALKRQEDILAVATAKASQSERAVLRQMAQATRSNVRRWQKRYDKYGFDGLIDWRVPPAPVATPAEVRTAICTLRRMDAN